MLLWTNLAVAATAAVSSSSFFLHSSQSKLLSKHRDHSAIRPVCAVVAMEMDPQLGFKIGPSVSVEFLPRYLCVVARRGVVLAVGNRLGGISLVCYFNKQHLNISDCVLVHANNYDIVTFLFSIIIIVGGASITPHVCNNAVDVHMQQDNIIMCRRLFIKRHAHFDHSCVYSSSLKSIYTVLLLLRCPIIFSDSGRKP